MNESTAKRTGTSLIGLWAGREKYVFINLATGEEHPVFIPRPEIYDRSELEEILLWQKERLERELQTREPRPALTRQQQHDLGQALLEVRASKQFRHENLHGRYW